MIDENSSLTTRLLDENNEEEPNLPNPIPPPPPPTTTTTPAEDAEALQATTSTIATTTVHRGEKQPPKFRDWQFAIVFILQWLTIASLGVFYIVTFASTTQVQGQPEKKDDYNYNTPDYYDDDKKGNASTIGNTFLLPILVSVGTALLLIILGLIVLTRMGKAFITCSLWVNVVISLIIGVGTIMIGLILPGILSLFSALIGICYVFAVKNRIPFAAANLDAGASSIRANGGITLIVLFLGCLMLGWIALWTASLAGLVDFIQVCDEDHNCVVQATNSGWIVPFVFLLFWTQQVFKNIIHTTVAGTVGTWYFEPNEASSFCSKGIRTSFSRSVTYSFGSICFGSLCVAIVQFLDWLVQTLRTERSENGEQHPASVFLLCCLDCILRLLQDVMEYFNKYAFVYVGVYGYPFITAGKNVMTLFKERGWTVVINDNLVARALGLMCFVISLLSGLSTIPFVDGNNGYQGVVFAIGFTISLLLSMTIMSIIDSAVTTVIVCFTEAPEALDSNHHLHSRNMREAWNKVYDIHF